MKRLQSTSEAPDGAVMLFGDQGFIALVDSMGDDTTIVNAARVSFGKKVETFDADKDGKLVDYLAKHKHMSPFRHGQLQFHIKMPEFLMRQIYKHVVGIEWTPQVCPTKDHAWNEISGRYVRYDEFYEPTAFRPQSEDNKQASEEGDLGDKKHKMPSGVELTVREIYQDAIFHMKQAYNALIDAGVAKEQARILCPFGTFTEVYWTCSLQAAAHFIKLRQHAGAQWEVRQVAEAVEELTRSVFPCSLEALMEHL